MIRRIIDVVRLLGRLNLSFSGHKEDQTKLNKGIFREIIEHFSQNDAVMKFDLENAKGCLGHECFTFFRNSAHGGCLESNFIFRFIFYVIMMNKKLQLREIVGEGGRAPIAATVLR